MTNWVTPKEAVEHARLMAARQKHMWIVGVLVTAYMVRKGAFTGSLMMEESISSLFAVLAGTGWVAAGLVAGLAVEALTCRNCMKAPQVFAERISAFREFRSSGVRGRWRYQQAASLDMSHIIALLPVLAQSVLIVSMLCLQWYLGHLYLLGLPVTSLQSGKHLFWRFVYAKEDKNSGDIHDK